MKTPRDECAILVASCDSYADVLAHFQTLFAKFWPDCPFEVVLVTESPAADLRVFSRQVACGNGKPWSDMLVQALDAISAPRVVLMMDDYFLSGKVDTSHFLARLADTQRLDAASLRLIPNPRTFKPFDAEFGEYPPNSAYCVSCQVSIWARDFLRRIAAQTTNAWEFERRGSFLCGDEKRPILVTNRKEFPFIDAVHKGYWERFAVKLCAENGITVDFSRRPPPNMKKRIVELVKAILFHTLPKEWIVRAQNALSSDGK